MFWHVDINFLKLEPETTLLAQNVKYFSYLLGDSFSQLSKEAGFWVREWAETVENQNKENSQTFYKKDNLKSKFFWFVEQN